MSLKLQKKKKRVKGRFYFNQSDDCEVLCEAFRPVFLCVLGNITLIREQKYWEANKTLDFHPDESRPDVVINLRLNPDFNDKEAMRYLKYLGFEAGLSRRLIQRQMRGVSTYKFIELFKWDWVEEDNSAVVRIWLDCLGECASAERLKEILLAHPNTRARWSRKLSKAKDLRDLRLSQDAAFRITKILFREPSTPQPFQHFYEDETLKKILTRTKEEVPFGKKFEAIQKVAQKFKVPGWGQVTMMSDVEQPQSLGFFCKILEKTSSTTRNVARGRKRT